MKKIIIILGISLMIILVGILYGNNDQSTKEEIVTLEDVYTAQFPDQMPEIVVAPMPAFSLY